MFLQIIWNSTLSCLVPIELKIGKFKPEHIGQINFYLEALDRDIKKPNENPSVGLILCATKDDAVVEYALSRSMSPTMVTEYTLKLPSKKITWAQITWNSYAFRWLERRMNIFWKL